jgi:hypothetical protein
MNPNNLENKMLDTTNYIQNEMSSFNNRKEILIYLRFIKDWTAIAIKLTKDMVRK